MSEPICIVGDSITGGVVYLEDSARYVRCKESFVDLLGGALGTEMRNHSKFGLTSEAALRKLGRFEGDIAQCPNTLVMLGGNDSDFNWADVADAPEAPHDCNTPVSRFRECYNAVLDRIIALGSRPVVISLIPVWGRRYYEWFSRKLDGAALMRFLGTTDSIEPLERDVQPRGDKGGGAARHTLYRRAQRLPLRARLHGAFQPRRHPPEPRRDTGGCSSTRCRS